jgi:molecular chaperone DnaK (HSP70)
MEVVGLKFGVTFCSIACPSDGTPVLLYKSDRTRIACVLAWENWEWVVGQVAEDFRWRTDRTTIYDAKRILGWGFRMVSIQEFVSEE